MRDPSRTRDAVGCTGTIDAIYCISLDLSCLLCFTAMPKVDEEPSEIQRMVRHLCVASQHCFYVRGHPEDSMLSVVSSVILCRYYSEPT